MPSEAIVVRILSVTAKNGKQQKNGGKFLRHKFKTRGAATASLLNGFNFFFLLDSCISLIHLI